MQRKKRTHVPQEEVSSKVPRSFVMERGAVGKAVGQLVLDMRQVMEPHTASKLKVACGLHGTMLWCSGNMNHGAVTRAVGARPMVVGA